VDVLTLEFDELPPSENKIKAIGWFTAGGPRKTKKAQIIYSPAAKKYKARFLAHARASYFAALTKFARTHSPTDVYTVELELVFPMWDVLTKGWLKKGKARAKTPYKKMDGPNRHKLLLDAFAEALGIDDSLSFDLRVTKLVARDGEDGKLFLTIIRSRPQDFGVPLFFLEA